MGLVRAAGLKPEKRQANPAKRESCRARNGNCRNWDRKSDDLSAHVDHRKGGPAARHPRPTSLPGMQLPLSLCRAECAAGSTGPAAIFLAFRRVLNGLYVDPVAPIDAPRDFAENEPAIAPSL
jgi:hypothetical protein